MSSKQTNQILIRMMLLELIGQMVGRHDTEVLIVRAHNTIVLSNVYSV